MDLLFPMTPETLTATVFLNRMVKRSLQRAHGLSVTQYRILSALAQRERMAPSALAKVLSLTAGRISQELVPLAERHLVDRNGEGLCSIASLGEDILEGADSVLAGVCEQCFEPIEAEAFGALKSGSLISNQTHGPVRLREGAFFGEYALLEVLLVSERLSRISSHECGLSLLGFRCIYELLDLASVGPGDLSRRLIAPKPLVSGALDQLMGKQLVRRNAVPGDRRAYHLELTDSGTELAQKTAVAVDRAVYGGIRSWAPGENVLYANMTAAIIEHLRTLGPDAVYVP